MEAISGLTLQPTKSHGFRRCAQKVAPYYIFGFLMFLGGFKASNPPEINESCYGPPVHVKFHPPPPSTPFKGGAMLIRIICKCLLTILDATSQICPNCGISQPTSTAVEDCLRMEVN